jgi:Tol biopolymer transport system component
LMFTVQSFRSPRELRIFPLAGNAGLETSPSFSPDSKQVAYSWDGNRGNFDIYLKAIGEGSPHRLTDNPGHDIDPAWSPDGQKIAFLRVLPKKSEVVIIPSSGGIERVLDKSAGSVRWHAEGPEDTGGAGPVWSSDGQYLIESSTLRTRGLQKLFLDGRHEDLTQPPPGMSDGSASVSPSGKFIAFKRVWGSDSCDLYVVASEGGAPRRLTFAGRDIQGVAWLDDNNILYSSNQAVSYHLWQVRRFGGNSRPFAVASSQPQRPALSRDGHSGRLSNWIPETKHRSMQDSDSKNRSRMLFKTWTIRDSLSRERPHFSASTLRAIASVRSTRSPLL